eukprot:15474865-Alexandrium_andersonii.AAC.1
MRFFKTPTSDGWQFKFTVLAADCGLRRSSNCPAKRCVKPGSESMRRSCSGERRAVLTETRPARSHPCLR